MDWRAVAAHTLQIAHGIGAVLACAASFYVAGLAVIPKRCESVLTRDEFPAVLGAAMYVLVCWFGIARGVPLTRLAISFAAVAFVVALLRMRTTGRVVRARLF